MASTRRSGTLLPVLFALFVFLNAAIAAHQHAHRHPERGIAERMAAIDEKNVELEKRGSYWITQGVKGVPVAPRLEIRNLQKKADQYALYILAMDKFMKMDQNNVLSYYQISGIHGRPFVSWNSLPRVNNAGMCPHVSNMFWPWHRPYLATFEQCWYENVKQIVAAAPASTRSRWQTAANSVRIPYWDWAAAPSDGQDVPAIIRASTVTVTGPSGAKTLANPLYSYAFHPASDAMGGSPFNSWPTTIRRPYRDNAGQAWRNNNNGFAAEMNNQRINLRDRVYRLFINNADFSEVSTEATGGNTGNPNSHDSFESTHDTVHVVAGGNTGPAGGGNMMFLDQSAMDPVFWLHHANVDRQFAMWQVINPTKYVESGATTQSNWQWNAGEVKNAGTPLKPFHNGNEANQFFTSNDVKNTQVFGYYYPETGNGATASSVRSAVNTLYGPSSTSHFRRDAFNGSVAYEGHPLKKGDYEYSLNINCDKFAIPTGSYSIYAFLGNVSTHSEEYGIAPNLIGSHGVLSMAGMSNGTAVPIEACIPLTTTLQGEIAKDKLESLKPYHVSAYLKTHLNWAVVVPGGKAISPDAVPGLHLSVSSCGVEPAAGPDEFPTWIGHPQIMPNVTAGKPAGGPWTPPKYTAPEPSYTEPSYTEPSYTESSVPYPTGAYSPNPEPYNPLVPSAEPGYCQTHQTIEYVSEDGTFLYSEKSWL